MRTVEAGAAVVVRCSQVRLELVEIVWEILPANADSSVRSRSVHPALTGTHIGQATLHSTFACPSLIRWLHSGCGGERNSTSTFTFLLSFIENQQETRS